MFGNLTTNKQIRKLIETHEIEITPFDEKKIRSAHYTLSVGRILRHNENFELVQVHTFEDNRKNSVYTLEPNAYVVVEPMQSIKFLNPGIVGRFIVPSTMIEDGLALISGQISNMYGRDNERVRFGLKNLLDRNFLIERSFRLAHIEFFDIRGLDPENDSSFEDRRRWAERIIKGNDDGITSY